jgi:hypothetical protein
MEGWRMKGLIIVLLFLPIAMGCATPTQRELDAEVNRLCVVDGGITVYEKVTLPPEEFDKYGVFRIRFKRQATPADKYYLEIHTRYYRQGGYDEPSLWRDEYLVVRRRDEKVLGKLVTYVRRGGDIPGPWHPTSYSCPPRGKGPSLEASVFVKGDSK